jgi:hypothetical protein
MTTNFKRLGLTVAVALLLPECCAHADLTWDFSYTVTSHSDSSSASGQLTTTSTPTGGPYTVTGISGTFTYDNVSESITGLIPSNGFLGNDNQISPTAPFLDSSGISFAVPSFTDNGVQISDVEILFRPNLSLYETNIGSSASFYSFLGGVVGEFHLAPATAASVPEPSTAIVAAFGAVALLAYGWSRHRRGNRDVGRGPGGHPPR